VATAGNEPTVANPITLNRTPVSYRSAPPRLGDATVTDDGAVVTAPGTDILELDGDL
jgi:hypothetical protein